MKDFLQRIKDLPPQKLALLAAQLQERLEQAEARPRLDEPIAVVGVGCRFPGGADDPESYWQLLMDGRDAVGEVPTQRWDADSFYDADWRVDGKMATKWGGCLEGVDRFDARLFGISPREAVTMDPQQRLLLEVTWQALERAAIAPSSLMGSRTGVFVGVSATDYLQLQMRRGVSSIDGYLASGSAASVASGRIAYVLGLHGPSLSVDTACSSSLVAVHLAVQALRSGQCDAAIGAGVNVILSPVTSIALSKSQMMAADGRCKAFSARADGFVRGEGCGVVVLKRLADAQRDGDPIVGVIRGTALNQDGRSNGLTAPNGPAQEAVLEAALEDAGLRPEDVGYVEAHGTGTKLGDPIEVQALGAVLGRGRTASQPLRIGSVKTNIGHLESAAGIAGLIKAMMVLDQGIIPAHLHLDEPSPVIPWDALPIDVPTVTTPWTAGQPRFAGVSSFGFSGTNAHVILEAPPAPPADARGGRAVEVLALSAQSVEALDEVAELHAQHLGLHEVVLSDLCRTLNTGRDTFAHREAFVAETTTELREALLARRGGAASRRSVRDHVESTRPVRPVWLFTGQGSQYGGMGRELYSSEPAFAAVLDRCDTFLREQHGISVLDVMLSPADPRIHHAAFAQPALYSLQVALAALWRSWGVQPSAVMGHSLGEYAAAHVAGLFDLEAGLSLTATRGQLMQSLPAGGRMVALLASPERIADALAPHAAFVSIAAVNGPDSIVISGDTDHVQAVLDTLGGRVGQRDLEVSHAFHSPAVEAIMDAFGAAAAGIEYHEPQVPIISNVYGEAAGRDRLGTPEYWRRHVREPVQFAPSMAALEQQGHRLFLELGPHPTLVAMAARWLDDPGLRWVHSLRKGRSETREMATELATLWTSGVAVDWSSWHGDAPHRRRILPTYPMQRERFWVEGVAPWSGDGTGPTAPTEVDGLVYEISWPRRAHPSRRDLPAGDFLRPAEDAEAKLDAIAPALAASNGIAEYGEFLPQLDALCAAYVLDGFRRLGLELRPGDGYSFETLVQKLKVVRPHHRLLRRLLEMLTEDGWLRAEADAWVATRDDVPEPAVLQTELADRFSAFAGELELVGRCGVELSGILRGQVDPLQVLFPGGSSAQMERIYRDSPMARTFNELVAKAVEEAVALTPEGRVLRVLEVGAGSGATTDSVLPMLAHLEVDYLFTDISASFTSKARNRYRSQPHVRFSTFDASRDPAPQGYQPASFDLIIAANVVHATPNLRTTLSNLRDLLTPGGQLVLLEATTRERFADLTVGFTPGWWAFEDTELRPDYALLSREQWRSLLADTGFGASAVAPTDADEPALRREAVIVASAPNVHVPSPAERDSQHWLLIGSGPLSDAVATELTDAGDTVSSVMDGGRALLRDAIAARHPSGVVVVHDPCAELGGTDTDADLRERHEQRSSMLLSTIQGLLDEPAAPPLWIVTQAAQGVDGRPVHDPDSATAWGVSHVVELEHPELQCRRIDLGDAPVREAARQLVRELQDPDPAEPQIAWRGESRFVRRLTRAEAAPRPPVVLDPAASYVISGGLRGIGLLVAGWMVERGARHLVLFGRNGPDEAAVAAVERWRQHGTDIVVEQADAGIDADVQRVIERATALGPVRGVIHGAGTLADAALLRQDWPHFETVFGPKVFGTCSLVRHLDPGQLDFLVLFSSGAGVAGSAGQANHAAASAYLDAAAEQLRGRGIKAVSIDWGAWTRVGAAAERGIDDTPGAFSPEQGLAVLEHVIQGTSRGEGPSQLLVHSPDWSDLLDRFPRGAEPSLYRDLLTSSRDVSALTADTTTSEAPPAVALWEQLLDLPERRQRILLRDEVRQLAAKVLDLDDAARIEVGQPLHDIGLDSLMAVELRNLLGVAMGRELPATLLFEHPSVTALVDHLVDGNGATGTAAEVTRSHIQDGPLEQPRPDIDPNDIDPDDIANALEARLDRLGRRG